MPGTEKFCKAWANADESGKVKLTSAVNHEIVRRMTGLDSADINDLAEIVKILHMAKETT